MTPGVRGKNGRLPRKGTAGGPKNGSTFILIQLSPVITNSKEHGHDIDIFVKIYVVNCHWDLKVG